MPSPFPGMDPFLEDPGGWPDFHHRYLTRLGDQLAVEVAPDFVVRVEERVYLTDPLRDPGHCWLVPDVVVTRSRAPALPVEATSRTMTITRPIHIAVLDDPEVRDRYVVVRDRRGGEIVTAIELLSPANKVAGSEGRATMDAKRLALLQGGANWIEIDLLRAGLRFPLAPDGNGYYAVLTRSNRSGLELWPVGLRDRLPTIAIPLDAEHSDAPLDLQAAFDETYDRAMYRLQIDYQAPIPPPALSPHDESWVRERIAAWSAAST